ncbi:hypothetical protein Ancab_037659 [Ancistrocladus abbreviatus]
MGDKDDGLELSLSLKCYDHQISPPSLQPNLSRSSAPPMQQSPSSGSGGDGNSLIGKEFQLSTSGRSLSINKTKTMSTLRGIGVSRPVLVETDEEIRVSSPNSTLSSVSGKKSEREIISDDEEGGGGGNGNGNGGERKKLRLTKEQSAVLEQTFREQTTLNTKQKVTLARQLNLRPRQVEVWFQNRRARTKLKQTEVDCEYLKRCCERLTEENRRLHKEVQELRALKLSPDFYSHMNPPTTLTLCSSCDRVAVSSTSSSPSAAGPVLANPPAAVFRKPTPITPKPSTSIQSTTLLRI